MLVDSLHVSQGHPENKSPSVIKISLESSREDIACSDKQIGAEQASDTVLVN